MRKHFLSADFLSHGGELGQLMRERDWARTPLGPPEAWPEILKSTLRLVLTSNHPMFIWWGPHLIQFYNDAYRKTMGPERHPEALGGFGKECWGEIWDIIGPQIASVMDGGPATWHVDQLVPVTRHGRREDVWWTYGYSPIQGNAGVEGVLVVCNDITAEHLAKKNLERVNAQLKAEIEHRERLEQRLPSLFAQAPGFMAIMRGPKHVFEFVNAAYSKFAGGRRLIGLAVRDAFPEVEGQGYFELLDLVHSTGRPYLANNVLVVLQNPGSSDKTHTYIDFVYQPMLDGIGAVTGIFVEGFDATERYLAQQALTASQQRLQEGLDAARMTVWNWNVLTGQMTFSENAATVLGAVWGTIQEAWACVHPEDFERLDSARQAAMAECGEYRTEVRFIRPDDGNIVWTQLSGKVICDEGGNAVAIRGITLDISARKVAEEKLLEADRRKNEFLAMLAHELRNPLAPISSAAEVLNLMESTEPRITKTAQIIARQVDTMSNLIEELLDVARVTTGRVSLHEDTFDITEVISQSVEQATPSIKSRQHAFNVQVLLRPVQIVGDLKRLVQAITNLLQNAAKFTPDGGTIVLRAEELGQEIVISVADNGIGIEGYLLPHVFDLFTQAKRTSDRAQGGLGLGLALVKNLVELHGGRVAAESNGLGKGCNFTIFLPIHRAAGGGHLERSEIPRSVSPVRRLRLLVVDDNIDAANAMGMLLESAGHHVVIENDPTAALEQIRTGSFDACLLDIGMPELDGYEVARRIRAMRQGAGLTLVAVSGYGQQSDKDAAIAAGFDSYLVKPATLALLLRLLADV
ncbi:MAG: hypothetical protein JWR22_2821 [Herminiimonas sp.]|nr:hypothetical protein [Herminiimonas sp.]